MARTKRTHCTYVAHLYCSGVPGIVQFGYDAPRLHATQMKQLKAKRSKQDKQMDENNYTNKKQYIRTRYFKLDS